MKGLIRSSSVLGLLLVSAVAASTPAPEPRNAVEAEVVRRLQAAIDAEVVSGFSGAVLVARSGRLLVDGVYGRLNGKPLPPEGRFLLASAAKQYVSAALLKLRDAGRLDLDDPVGKHLADVPADKQSITIRQLLSHTSGLPQGYDSESAATRQEAERAILKLTLVAAPGGKFQYSNENYQLGVALVEAVSGRRYVDFLRDELLRPAGLRDTGQLDGPGSIESLSPTAAELPPRLLNLKWGGFGFYATARDFYRWYGAIRGGNLLSPQGVEELFAPTAKIGEGHSALGWFVGSTAGGEKRIFTRGNDDVGSSSVLYAYPASDVVIVVLSHAGQKSDELSWARAVHTRIEEILFGDPGK